MNDLITIPCVLMRGGTSRGPFFLANDLPMDEHERNEVLLDALGSGHPQEIDGIGGGYPVTSKVAIISRSTHGEADVDYLFAQVSVLERMVDTSPNCGNMLAAVGPFAIEAGLVASGRESTLVRIRNVNTGKLIDSKVLTPNGQVTYSGSTRIDGVPGTAAPIVLTFLDAEGAATGKLFPTGERSETLSSGIRVTCIDCAMPMVLAKAEDFGVTGYEDAASLSSNRDLVAALSAMRIEAGHRFGIVDPENRVVPKPVLLAAARSAGVMSARYFMPHECHPALATTGAVGLARAAVTPGTVAASISGLGCIPDTVCIEHPAGTIEVALENREGYAFPVAGVVRTARRLFDGKVYVGPRTPRAAA